MVREFTTDTSVWFRDRHKTLIRWRLFPLGSLLAASRHYTCAWAHTLLCTLVNRIFIQQSL